MGFFSAIFGSNSKWDGASYVEMVSGNKYWHKGFIDKDEMRRFGSDMAARMDIMGPRVRKQSPETMIHELVFLMMECERMGDTKGQKYVARAMQHALDNLVSELPQFAELTFSTTGFRDYV